MASISHIEFEAKHGELNLFLPVGCTVLGMEIYYHKEEQKLKGNLSYLYEKTYPNCKKEYNHFYLAQHGENILAHQADLTFIPQCSYQNNGSKFSLFRLNKKRT